MNKVEERFDKLEDMLSQLLQMVGSMKADQEEMKKDITGIKADQEEMKKDITGIKADQLEMKAEITGTVMKTEMTSMKIEISELKATVDLLKRDNDEAHKKIEKSLTMLQRDQDFIWKKAVQNEREIARLVKQQNKD